MRELKRQRPEGMDAFHEGIQRLPSLESRTVQWFKYLVRFGNHLLTPYSEYFDTALNGFYLQLHSGFWRYGKQALWGVRFSNVDMPFDHRDSEWLTNYLELLFHSMPHQVLVVENLYEFFPAGHRSPCYWGYMDNWCVRVRPGATMQEDFDPERFRQISIEEYQALGGNVNCPAWYGPGPVTNAVLT